MSEIIRWAIALAFMASLWGMAAFLIYHQSPGWGWFLACVTFIMSFTNIEINKTDNIEDSTVPHQPPDGYVLVPIEPTREMLEHVWGRSRHAYKSLIESASQKQGKSNE